MTGLPYDQRHLCCKCCKTLRRTHPWSAAARPVSAWRPLTDRHRRRTALTPIVGQEFWTKYRLRIRDLIARWREDDLCLPAPPPSVSLAELLRLQGGPTG